MALEHGAHADLPICRSADLPICRSADLPICLIAVADEIFQKAYMITLVLPNRGLEFFCSEFLRFEGAPEKVASFFMPGMWLRVEDNRIEEGPMMERIERDFDGMGGGASREACEKKGAAPLPATRKRLVTKLWKTAEKQVAQIEARLCEGPDDPLALERDAKTLSIIARTVRDLVALEADLPVSNAKDLAHGPNQTLATRDVTSFRLELAQKLDQLRQEGARAAAAGAPDA
jgi:hypothetical protein